MEEAAFESFRWTRGTLERIQRTEGCDRHVLANQQQARAGAVGTNDRDSAVIDYFAHIAISRCGGGTGGER